MGLTYKGALMLSYNGARRLAKQRKLDIDRVNRGFGLAQSKEFRQGHHGYICNDKQCNCADAMNREVTCKHSIALGLLMMAEELASGS